MNVILAQNWGLRHINSVFVFSWCLLLMFHACKTHGWNAMLLGWPGQFNARVSSLKTHSTVRMRTNRSDLQLANASILLVFISELKENASKCNKDFRSTRENYQQCMIRRLQQETYILYFWFYHHCRLIDVANVVFGRKHQSQSRNMWW